MEFVMIFQPMNSTTFATNLRPTLRFFRSSSSTSRSYCVSAAAAFDTQLITPKVTKRGGIGGAKKASDAILKENWLASLSSPSVDSKFLNEDEDVNSVDDDVSDCSNLVIGIDPDLSGALAVLRSDASGCSAEVFDSPTVSVLVGSRVRRRLDAHSIVKLLRTINAPFGTKAYIEQSAPFPQDGKQGWYAGGFGYGLWIGILVASGFSVIPVSSLMWKNEYELSGSRMCKDDSRKLASTLFPSVTAQLKRKKDHGRAEALLIAAYGNGFRIKSRINQSAEHDPVLELLYPSDPPSPVLERAESAGVVALV